jgi:hypothetical protein
MGLQSSDLILVERSNTIYKETYGNRANIDSSDLLLVERGNTLYKCERDDWDGGGSGSTPVAADLLVVERPSATLSMTATLGATTLYVSAIPGALSSGTILVFAGSSGHAQFTLTSSASAGATTLTGSGGLKGSNVNAYTVGGVFYKATKTQWGGSYADIHSANYMVTLGTLTYGVTGNNATNFSVVETQVEVSSSSSSAKGNLFIGFRNSAPTAWQGDLPIAAFQILHANGTTFRETDEFLMDFNFAAPGSAGVNGRYYWETTNSTNTNASTHPNTYSYYAIDDTRTKREFSYTEIGTVSSWVGAAHGISTSTYDSDGGTVLAVGNQNISQYNAGTAGDDGYIFSECSGTDTGDLTWLYLVNTGYIHNGDRIRICYFGGANGQTSSAGLQTANSLYLRFEED